VTIKPGEKCECGQPLPWHLFGLGFGMDHVCSCERKYKSSRDGLVVLDGTAANPFTRYDRDRAGGEQ
jgi:hypothetical protein